MQFKKAVGKWPNLQNEDDVDAFIKKRKADADYVKLFHEDGRTLKVDLPKPSVELQRMVIEKAHANGMPAFAHAFGLASAIEILNAGADGTAHTIVDHPPTLELIEAYKKNNAYEPLSYMTCISSLFANAARNVATVIPLWWALPA